MLLVGIILFFIFVYTHFRRDLLRCNSKHYSQFTQFTLSLVLLSSTSDCYLLPLLLLLSLLHAISSQSKSSRTDEELYYQKKKKPFAEAPTQMPNKEEKKNPFAYIFTLEYFVYIVFYLPLYLMDFSSIFVHCTLCTWQMKQSDPWIYWCKFFFEHQFICSKNAFYYLMQCFIFSNIVHCQCIYKNVIKTNCK